MEPAEDNKIKAKVFNVPPPTFPGRIVIFYIELTSPTSAHFWFGGNTLPFKQGFESMSISGRTQKTDPTDTYGEYYRSIEHVDISQVDESTKSSLLLNCW